MAEILHNRVNKNELKKKLIEETIVRKTISFYKYVIIDDPKALRDQLFAQWRKFNIFGRIYLAIEGINAQMSIPESNWHEFVDLLYADARFKDVPFKYAVEDDGKSFYKLAVKVREKIVADGLDNFTFDVTNVGQHLTAKAWNEKMQDPEAIVVDMRNHYESEIGHFENAICPDVDTFREELPLVKQLLEEKKDKPLLLYCTGGIRCEKASAYFKHHGFQNVNQLYGGVIEYAKQVKEQGLENKFKGKNFVFDERLGETIGEEIISQCHQCGAPCDKHTNCANDDCHLLFLQCEACKIKHEGCCKQECIDIIHLPIEEQKKLRKGKIKTDSLSVYKSRLRPKLNQL